MHRARPRVRKPMVSVKSVFARAVDATVPYEGVQVGRIAKDPEGSLLAIPKFERSGMEGFEKALVAELQRE